MTQLSTTYTTGFNNRPSLEKRSSLRAAFFMGKQKR